MKKNFYEIVYEIVKKIPSGKVTTYGHIALMAGNPNAARAVGYALKHIPLSEHNNIPWHRVINAKREISIRNIPGSEYIQKDLLVKENIEFDENDKVDFNKFGWFPYIK